MDNNQTNVLDRPNIGVGERPTSDGNTQPTKAQPKTANEVLARVDEDHNYRHEPIDMNTTGGVQKAIERNWRGLQALADFVDGNAQKAI